MRQLCALLTAVLCLGIAGPSAAAPPVPFDLGVLPGDESSYSNAISGNGHVVGSSFSSSARHAFSWTAAAGMINLGSPVYNFERFSMALHGETPAEKLQRLLPAVQVA